jgi:hypothetical protein
MEGRPTNETERLHAARAAADAGDEAAAEHVFLQLVEESRATGSALERLSSSSLVTLYGRQRRHFEVVTLARRLGELGAAERDPGSVAYGAFARATAWTDLHVLDAAERELDLLARALPELKPESRASLGRMHRLLRARIAVGRGAAARARAWFELYVETFDGPPQIDRNDRLSRDVLHAEVCALEGRIDAGLVLLDTADLHAKDASDVVTIQDVRLRLLAGAGRFDELRRSAREYVRTIERLLRELPYASQAVWDGARRLLAVLEGVPGSERLVLRAWELVSTAFVRRMQELARAVDRLPELLDSDPADLAAFRAVRDASARWRDEQRGRLLPLLADLDAGVPPDANVLLICAWCDSIAIGDGRWVPLLERIEVVGPVPASHGMCTECAARMEAEV